MIRSITLTTHSDASTGNQRPLRSVLKGSGAPYLVALFVTPVVTQFAQYVFPGVAVLGAQPLSVVLAFIGTSVALALWFLYTPQQSWPLLFQLFSGSLAFAWMFAVVTTAIHGDSLNLTAFLVPICLFMVWLKRPHSRDVWRAGDTFAWSIIAVAVAAQVLDWLGLRELRYDFWNRLPVIDQVIGPIGRWEGPFGNSNLAGPIGAFLVAYGLYRYGLSRWAMVITGGVIVFLSDSRTGYLGLLVALLVAALYRPRIGRFPITRTTRAVALVGAALAFVGLVALLDPTLNGRTSAWSTFLSLSLSSPVTGVGGEGIAIAIQGNGLLDGWASHGHNLLIDPLARTGFLGTFPILVGLISALALTLRAAKLGKQAGLVVLACFLASGITEDVVDWRYLGVQALPLLLGTMLGALSTPRLEKNASWESQ
ncbi:O-antigen ligase family protein [bacterium]|nr:O-antigen ligase family protein [bacterium]